MKTLKKLSRLFLKKIKKEKEITYFLFFLSVIFILFQIISSNFLIEIPQKGGILNEIVINEKPNYINPILVDSESNLDKNLISLIYSPLFKKDNTGKIINNIASYKISNDGKEYTIFLKDNVLFHDNIKMTTDDIIYTIEKIQNPRNKSLLYSEWVGIKLKKISDKELKIILPKPDNYFINSLVLYILPKHIWINEDFRISDENKNPTGSGPFLIEKIIWKDVVENNKSKQKIEKIILSKNNHYFKEIYIDKIIFNIYDSIDDYKKSNLFQENSFQNIFSYDKLNFESYKEIEIEEPVDINFIFKANNKNKVLNIKNLRRYIFNILNGKNLEDEKKEILKNKNFSWDEKESVLKYKKQIVQFNISTGDNKGTFIRLSNNIKNKLREAGISVTLKVLNVDEFWDTLKDRNYESIISGYQNDEKNIYYYYHSSQKNYPGANIAQINSKEIDKLLKEIKSKNAVKSKLDKIELLKRKVSEEFLILKLLNDSSHYYLKKDLYDIKLDRIISGENRFDFIDDWVMYSEKVLPYFKK